MPTITLTPSACTASSGWKTLYYYENSSDLRQLIFTFPANATLGGAGVNITGITLRGYVRNSSTAAKRLKFGCKDSTSVSAGSWSSYQNQTVLDYAFTAASAANGSYQYFRISRSLSGEVLSKFAGHMQNKFSAGSALYLGVIQPDSGKSIQVDPTLSNWKIDVAYELLGNVPSANVSSAVLGQTAVKTTVSKVVSGSTTTLRYKIGSTTLSTVSLGTGTSHTYTPPTSAGQYFPNAKTAAMTIEAETFVGSTSYGVVSTSVTLTLPSDAAPTASATAARTWVSGVSSSAQIAAYVQRKSGISLALSGIAKYGASISGYRVTIENKSYTGSSVIHSPISGSGTVTYTFTVTDSRGLSRTYTASISVLAWSEPKITGFNIARVTSGNVEDVGGTYARATVKGSVSSLSVSGSEKNKITYYVRYRKIGESAWTNCDSASLSATSVNQSVILKKNSAAIGTFDDMTGYEFQLLMSDIYATSTAQDEMPTKETLWDVNEENGSMGFGGEATGTGSSPEYDFYGLIRARSGIEGVNCHSSAEKATGGKWIDGKEIYARTVSYTTPSTANAQVAYSFNFSGIDTVWIDVSGSFLRNSNGLTYPIGYVASDGGRQFMVMLNKTENKITVVSDSAGTAYVRLFYTKS